MKVKKVEDSLGIYFINYYGKTHRVCGPANIWRNGNIKGWFLEGLKYSQKEWLKELLNRACHNY